MAILVPSSFAPSFPTLVRLLIVSASVESSVIARGAACRSTSQASAARGSKNRCTWPSRIDGQGGSRK